LNRLRALRNLAAVAISAVWLGMRPGSWPRTVRTVLARQIFFTGVQAVLFMTGLAVFVGLGVVVQAQFWMARLGQSELLGPFLVIVIVREIGPLLVNLVVIGRSGTAMATELGSMSIRNEVKVLDAQGLDPMIYLVMPRILGTAISVFCLAVLFAVVSLGSGYFCGLLLGVGRGSVGLFLFSVMKSLTPADILNLLAKTLAPGLLVGAICCVEGLAVRYVTEVPQAATRCVVRANFTVFMICAVVSLLTYI
jgi:phospholipid/cholesterol/gamma-HCH transport system permease protein